MEYRTEKDSLGPVKVPANVYWGAQTQRSKDNFKIGGQKMPIEVIRAFAILKKAAAQANLDLEVLPKNKSQLIGKVCDEILKGQLDDQFPLVVWQTGSGTQSNMNLNEVIANRAHVLKGGKLDDDKKVLHPNDDVNKSQSSNDTFPTAMSIAAYTILVEKTIPALKALHKSLQAKAKAFTSIVKIGRTHLMDATPLTLGQEFSGYASQIEHGIKAIENTLSHLSELALGGTAVGTGLNAPKGYDKLVAKKIATLTGHPFVTAKNKFASLAAHDAIVSAHGALKTVAVSLNKIANDIRLLASGPRSGIGEINIPSNEPGSSIMPGKVNPSLAECLNMICFDIIGKDVSVTMAAQAGQFELNVMMPGMLKNVLDATDMLINFLPIFATNFINGIQANSERLKQQVEKSPILITLLNPYIGYLTAAEIYKESLKTGRGIRELILGKKLMTEKELEDALSYERIIGLV